MLDYEFAGKTVVGTLCAKWESVYITGLLNTAEEPKAKRKKRKRNTKDAGAESHPDAKILALKEKVSRRKAKQEGEAGEKPLEQSAAPIITPADDQRKTKKAKRAMMEKKKKTHQGRASLPEPRPERDVHRARDDKRTSEGDGPSTADTAQPGEASQPPRKKKSKNKFKPDGVPVVQQKQHLPKPKRQPAALQQAEAAAQQGPLDVPQRADKGVADDLQSQVAERSRKKPSKTSDGKQGSGAKGLEVGPGGATARSPRQQGLMEQMRAKLSGSRFRWLNEQLYTCPGDEALTLMQEQPHLFQQYHEVHIAGSLLPSALYSLFLTG